MSRYCFIFIKDDFYPRPPRGGRRWAYSYGLVRLGISIHALREEGDRHNRLHPAAGRISIHALREEGDLVAKDFVIFGCDFYPRPPRGGRPADIVVKGHTTKISIHALREEGDVDNRKSQYGT